MPLRLREAPEATITVREGVVGRGDARRLEFLLLEAEQGAVKRDQSLPAPAQPGSGPAQIELGVAVFRVDAHRIFEDTGCLLLPAGKPQGARIDGLIAEDGLFYNATIHYSHYYGSFCGVLIWKTL